MHILVTNDDGIGSPGLWALAGALQAAGLGQVTIVAPEEEQSGMSMALSPRRNLTLREVPAPDPAHAELRAYAFSGTPVGCVMAGILAEVGPPPTAVVAGINMGLNTGTNVLLSGTVGAAMLGALWGRPAMAVSQMYVGDNPMPWATAAWAAVQSFPLLEALGGRGPLVLNLNVPHIREPEELRGFRQTELSSFFYGSVVELDLADEPIDAEGRRPLSFRFRRDMVPDFPEYTDDGAVRAGFCSLTLLTPTGVAVDADLTAAIARI